jgi:hypothetical protein
MRVHAPRVLSHLTYANLMSTLAVVLALGTGTAYAANTVFSTDIVDGEVKNADLATSAVSSAKVANNNLLSADVKDDTLAGGGLTAPDLAPDSVGSSEIAASSVGPSELGYGSVGSDQIANGSVGSADLATIERWHYIGDAGEPAFENGWSNYDTSAPHTSAQWQQVAYAKDAFGNVHVRGLIKGGTVGQIMFHLPSSYCPWFYHAYGVIANNGFSRFTVQWVSGDTGCGVYVENGSNAWVSLEGVTFQNYGLEDRTFSAPSAAASAPGSLPGSAPINGPARALPKR